MPARRTPLRIGARLRRADPGHARPRDTGPSRLAQADRPLAPLQAARRHGLGRREALHQRRDEGIPAPHQVVAAQGRGGRAGLQQEAAVSNLSGEQRMLAALNRLTKWRTHYAGWQLGTRAKGDPESDAVRDHRELTMLLRVELTALTGLLMRKGVIAQ